MQHGCGAAFYWFQGKSYFWSCWLIAVPVAVTELRICAPLAREGWGGGNPWNELLSKVCLEWELPDSAGSRVRMEHGWKHSSWHRSKWLILHLLLSRMSCTPSIIAITASWPTFTSADTAACRCRHSMCVFALLTLKRKPSGYPILYIKWRSVEMHTAAQLQVPFCSTVTLHAHIWFH